MKKVIILATILAAVFCSCNRGTGSYKTEMDSLAYAFGVDIGTALKNMDSTMNIDLVSAGIRDVFKNRETMTMEESYEFRREYFMVRLPEKNAAASEAFLAEKEKQSNVQKTESGLLYEIINPGEELRARDDRDTVLVVYHGALKDGRVFDSSKERDDTARFTLNRVIKGWSEGMKLVGKGGTIRLYIPSDLGYGPNGMGQNIGPNEALVFDVDVVDVLPADVPEEE